ncbi:MAG: ABC transporter substrate-binding protein, partial [Actinomycetota bacterium]|nr:ABC transporter substrate-binding protein [Actinomycetota bacterium]
MTLLTMAVLIAACSSRGEPGSDVAAWAGGEGAARAEQLTIALAEDQGPLNIFADQNPPIDGLVYDKLLAPSPYVEEPGPWLATEVRQVDPSTWEVELRQDVTWHDGQAFDAEDVAFT